MRPALLRRTATIRFTVLAVLVAGLAGLMLTAGPDRERLLAALGSHHGLAPVLAIAGSALLTTALVPRTLLSIVGGLLFGWFPGTGYVLVGITLGALVSFLIGRFLGRDFIACHLRGRLLDVEQRVADRGMLAVLISRLIPLVPFCVSNYVFGTTSLRFLPFVAGTVLGAAPATLAYAGLGSATAHGDATAITAWTVVVFALGAGGTVGTYLVWRRRPRKAAATG